MYSMEEMIGWSILYSETRKIGKIEILEYSSEKLFRLFKKSQEMNINIFEDAIEKKKLFDIFSKESSIKNLENFLNKKRNIKILKIKIENEIKILEERNIKYITYNSPEYPQDLKKFRTPPFVLYYRGEFMYSNIEKNMTLVGTRKPEEENKDFLKEVIKYLKKEDLNVVSGLARGCDELSHKMTLAEGIRNIAILGQGLGQNIYPKENENLAKEIIEKGGVLVSEIPPSFTPKGIYFLQRNRIQSYLSKKICIIESGKKGGTIYTLKVSLQEKKDIFIKDSEKNKKIISERNKGRVYFIKKVDEFDKNKAENLKLFDK